MTRLAANLTLIIVGSILGYLLWNDNIEFRFDSEKEKQEVESTNTKNESQTYYEPLSYPNFENNDGIVEERYENLNKKIVRVYQGQGKNEKTIEETIYAENGVDIIGKTNYVTNESMKIIFNQNGKKIKKIELKNEKPTKVWEYYDGNGDKIGSIDFNKKTSLSKVLGEWILEETDYSIKKIFFKDKILEQWNIDVNGEYWIKNGITKYSCSQIFGKDICQDKENYNNHLSYEIKYPPIESIKDKQHIIVNTSKIKIYGDGIDNKEQKLTIKKDKIKNGFHIQLINDSTLMITEDGNIFKYKKVY